MAVFVSEFVDSVDRELATVREVLISKNEAYGNSALEPLRVFSSASASDGLRVRIDDKLSRLARGSDAGEDTVLDLIGYLILLRIGESGGNE